jgi:hypothetical protein
MRLAQLEKVARAAKAATTESFLFVQCGDWMLLLPHACVQGVALADDLLLERGSAADSTLRGWLGVGELRRQTRAALDLRALLGVEGEHRSWILVDLPSADGTLRLCLAAGTVARFADVQTARVLPLPRGLAPRHPGLWRAAVVLPQSGDHATAGICLDVARLWTPAELRQLATLLRNRTAEPAARPVART